MFKLRLYGLLSPNRFLCKLEHSRIPNGVLKRSSSINASLRDINPRKIGRYIENYLPVLTLDPNKFAEKKQPRLCISKLQKFTFHVALQNQSIPVVAPCLYYDRSMVTKRFSCPPDTKAFLYYFTPPDKPRIAGEVRLRVTPNDDPASFESGFDLLKTDGRPWMRPLCLLSKNCIPLYEKLREDQLVPNDLDAVLSTLPSTYLQYSPGQLLYTLNDTFIVDFSKLSWIFTVVTEQGMKKLPFGKPFSSSKFRGKPIPPYTGSALVRFERSSLPEHKGTRTVVLRFLKIITPVKCVIPLYEGYIRQPKEGELYRRTRKGVAIKNVQPAWSINIDDSKGAMIPGFRLLWDAY